MSCTNIYEGTPEGDQPLTLDLFFSTVERHIRQHLPVLEIVASWPDIRERISLPALLLELAEVEPGTDPGTGRVALTCRLEARVVVAAEEPEHHQQAIHIATQLAVLLRAQYWELDDVDAAEFVHAGPDWTRPELDSCTVWKVEWTQQIYLGEEQWPWPDAAPAFLEPQLYAEQVDIEAVAG